MLLILSIKKILKMTHFITNIIEKYYVFISEYNENIASLSLVIGVKAQY